MEHLNKLTPREREVLKIIGQGKTTKQVAEEMGLSVATVGNHRKHICKKLELHSTAELVAFAAQYRQQERHGNGQAPGDQKQEAGAVGQEFRSRA
ncbi:MAG: hypothetical protein DMG57_36170 [Acidobacteria bacterium]|nr:MAG: hypothetical protein DMG57_36170 [Acidobacteriota bacterium]